MVWRLVTPSLLQSRRLGTLGQRSIPTRPWSAMELLCQSALYHIRDFAKIRRFLDRNSCERIVHAFVTSQLDLNNALLTGTVGDTVSKLQKVQNIAVQVVTHMRGNHITPVLKDLHWMPVPWRIKYKVLLQAYKAQHGLAPTYISEHLHPHHPSRAPRSATDGHCSLSPWPAPLGETGHLVRQSVLCNALPRSIRTADWLDTFKSAVKSICSHAPLSVLSHHLTQFFCFCPFVLVAVLNVLPCFRACEFYFLPEHQLCTAPCATTLLAWRYIQKINIIIMWDQELGQIYLLFGTGPTPYMRTD